jgi:hypothetical protein
VLVVAAGSFQEVPSRQFLVPQCSEQPERSPARNAIEWGLPLWGWPWPSNGSSRPFGCRLPTVYASAESGLWHSVRPSRYGGSRIRIRSPPGVPPSSVRRWQCTRASVSPWREGAAPGVEDGGTQPLGPWGCSSSPALHNDGLFLDAYASLPPSPTHTRTRARMVFPCFCVRGQRPGPLENHGFFMFLCVGTEAGTLEKPWFFMFLCVGTEAGHLAAPSSRPRAREGAKARPHSRPPRQSRAEGELRHARRRR